MTPTTDLQKLLAEATKGPWSWKKLSEFHSPKYCVAPGVLLTDEKDGTPWGDTIDQANSRLIAMAPDLAARVLELEAENKRLREADEMMKAALVFYADDGAKRNRNGPWMQDSIDFGDLAQCTLAQVAALKGGEI